jgi:hypothetical protein
VLLLSEVGAAVSEQGGVGRVLENKARLHYRITKASIVWIVAALLLVPYEILCIARGVDGGPLTHVVKWAYGEPHSLRWWLLGFANTGFLLWLPPHFLFEGPGLRSLIVLVSLGLVIGAVGYLITR